MFPYRYCSCSISQLLCVTVANVVLCVYNLSSFSSSSSLPRDTLSSAPRQELEKRLESALIVAEVLSQQLIASRESQSKAASVGPSEQRDRLVQTDHTEFSQVGRGDDSLALFNLNKKKI